VTTLCYFTWMLRILYYVDSDIIECTLRWWHLKNWCLITPLFISYSLLMQELFGMNCMGVSACSCLGTYVYSFNWSKNDFCPVFVTFKLQLVCHKLLLLSVKFFQYYQPSSSISQQPYRSMISFRYCITTSCLCVLCRSMISFTQQTFSYS
jgi:hypothetical protein